MASLPQRRPRSHNYIFLSYDELRAVSFEIKPHAPQADEAQAECLTRRPFMASLPQRRPRSHNSIFLSYDELRAVSFEIKPHAPQADEAQAECLTRRPFMAFYHNGGPGL